MNTPNKKILIIDDDPLVCDCILKWLKENGFACDCADERQEAVEKIKRSKPDIIILDTEMQANGLETYKMIRETPGAKNIPVIFLSSWEKPDWALLKNPGEPVKYLEKPCDLNYITAAISNLIRTL